MLLHQHSFASLREFYRDGRHSPVEIVRSALDHAQHVDRQLNAFAWLDAGRALQDAQRSHQRWQQGRPLGPLDGLPVTVKEFAAVAGWPTRRGSAVTSNDPAAVSTVFVGRLQAAGAVVLGKTRAPEYNWKGVTDSPAFGITRNPWDPRLTPGGSSGGCSAAVAAGVVHVSMGSDAGGSVRIPAAFTGLYGLKPSFGRVPVSPLPSAFSSIVHTGPIASSMAALADVMQVVSGPSARDWSSMLGDPVDHAAALRQPARSLKVGLLARRHWQDSTSAVHVAMEDVIEHMRRDGFAIEELDFDVRAASAVGAAFYRFGCIAAVRAVPPAQHGLLDPGLLAFVQSVEDVSLQQYQALSLQRDQFNNQLAALFDTIDLLVLPTLPIVAFDAGRLTPAGWPSDDWMSWNPFTPAFNIAQVPALSCPVWPAGSPLPVGIQFVAPRLREDRLMAIGAWFETHHPARIATLPG